MDTPDAFDIKSHLSNLIIYLQSHRLWVILAFFAFTVFCLFFIKQNLGMNTSTKDMLSSELDWRKLDSQHEALFPQYTDNILVVIESATPDQSTDAAIALYDALRQNSELFKTIYFPEQLSYFRRSSFLFLNTDELYDLSDQLARIQPFLGSLIEDQSISGLFKMLSDAIDAIDEGENIDLTPLINEINRGLEALLNHDSYFVSWHSLMSGEENTKSFFRQFIILQPHLDYSGLFPAEESISHIRSVVDKLNLEQEYGVDVRLSGSTVLSHEELQSVSQANWSAIVISLVLVAILLIVGLGSPGIVLACMLTLICGLVLTTAFATATVGELNLISVAFAVLYIGLGIDFAIHYSLRYREHFNIHQNSATALIHSTREIFRSLFLCSITTAIGFFAFIPTDYTGVAELGWIAGCGMFISLILTFTLLPVLLSYSKRKFDNNTKQPVVLKKLQLIPYQHSNIILGITIILAATILTQISKIEFDTNTLNLQDQSNESVRVYKSLLDDSSVSPWTAIVLAKNKDSAGTTAYEFEKLEAVDKVVWLDKFIPENQDEKLLIIEEMNLLLGELFINENTRTTEDHHKLTALDAFYNRLNNADSLDDSLNQLRNNLAAIINSLSNKTLSLTALENTLLKSFPGRIALLADALEAENVESDSLPDALINRWLSNNIYQLEIYPADNLDDNAALNHFVNETRKINPDVIGSTVIIAEAGHAVSKAFQQAFLYSFVCISLLLLFLMRSLKDTLIILFSLSIGALFTSGLMLLFQIPMNFANIIALPLLLGIGVDSGIHILDRYRSDNNGKKNILGTSTSRGVMISALTTIFSIGNLSFSSHQGTASMGLLLVLGIVSMVLCMLILLPSLLVTIDSLSGKSINE